MVEICILFDMTKDKLTAINVSFYRNMKSADAKPATIGQVLTAIRSSFYESQVTTIRQLKSQGKQVEADEIKSNLHAVTFCATFNGRRLSSLYHTYNSLMVIDIDKLPDEEIERVKECLEACPFVATYWKSPSGAGWKGLVPLNYLNLDRKTDAVDMHHWAFNKLEAAFKADYNIILDSSGKDITRLCFMSWSPELRLKDTFDKYDVDLEEMKTEKKVRKNNGEKMPVLKSSGEPIQWNVVDGQKQGDRTGTSYDRRTMERIYKFLSAKGMSITSTYDEWVKVAFAIAQTFHSTYGRKMFMKLCELDGAAHNEERSERLIYDAYTTTERRSDFSSIIYLANRKGFIR